MMERLLNRNIVGYYLPTCEVWHFVPKTRCSPEWVLSRVFQEGVGAGIEISRAVFRSRAKRALISGIKVLWIRILLVLFGKRLEARRRFHYEYLKNRHSGILRGLKGTKVDQR